VSIDKDIQMIRRFRNEHHKVVVNLLFTSSWTKEYIKKHLARFDLSMQQFNILRILNGSGKPISTLAIRERMSDTSRIVERLIKKQLVKKSLSQKDKRLVDVSITKKGKNLIAKIDGFSNEIDDIVQALDENEAFLLNNLLDKIQSGLVL
jgi:DNA-binding MarR family transcriptional regulator